MNRWCKRKCRFNGHSEAPAKETTTNCGDTADKSAESVVSFWYHRNWNTQKMPAGKKAVSDFLADLLDKDLKGGVEEVLAIGSVVKDAKRHLTDTDFRDLRDRAPFQEKVWSKLLQIGLDDRLSSIKDALPSGWSSIHQIHCLNDEELKEAVEQGVIHPRVSQGAINRWLKHFRFEEGTEQAEGTFADLVMVQSPEGAAEQDLERFKGDLEKLVSVYGFRLRYGTEDSMAVLRQQRSSDKAHELASALAKDLRSTWEGADESLKTLFSLTSLDDLVQSPMASFTGFLNRVRGGREEFWRFHGKDYVNKNALEYLKSDSRGQRFNYRRRLKEVAEKQSHLAACISQTLEEWMKY